MSSDYGYESFDLDTLRQLDQLEEAGFGLAAEPSGLQNLAAGHVLESLDADAVPTSLPSSAPVIIAGARKRKKVVQHSSSPIQETPPPPKKLRSALYPSGLKAGTSTAEAAAPLDLDAVHSGSETLAGQESGEEEAGDVAGLMAEPGRTQGSSGSYDQQAVYMQSLQPSQGHSSNEDREPARVSQVTSREDSIDEYERNSFLVSDDISEVEDGQDSG